MAISTRIGRIIAGLSAMIGVAANLSGQRSPYGDPFPGQLKIEGVPEPKQRKTPAKGRGVKAEKRRAEKKRKKKKAKRSKKRRR